MNVIRVNVSLPHATYKELTEEVNNEHSPIVSIAPITSNVSRVYSFEVEIPAGTSGMTSLSKIMVNQTMTVDNGRLVQLIGTLPAALMAQAKASLKLHYDISG